MESGTRHFLAGRQAREVENPAMRSMLARRRDRSIAIILSEKEKHCDDHLPEEAAFRLRKVVLDQVNDLHDFCSDLLRSLEDGSTSVSNDLYLDRLNEIYDMVRDIYEDE